MFGALPKTYLRKNMDAKAYNAGGALSAEEVDKIADMSRIQISEVFAAVDDPALIREFFTCLFTPSEIREFSLRWALVNEILEGRTQREISRRFGMSLCKITRGSRELKRENAPFKRMIDIYAAISGKGDNLTEE